ncbi:hypothetical protein B0H13DRAFT_1657081 [Mycena leptocephala]|nr:hypothetical protein B0H13DRAFT_1657081 [Mycena leptocephala]
MLPSTRPAHPLLTPSGRAFASGGKVKNISRDPWSPCMIYWPDNEVLPEQGQIRPSGATNLPYPPIIPTGNRGPIPHQPGDWICLKCNYLNWRRRKVCQTCFPYAEGNGDSISAAIHAERTARLTTVLATSSVGEPAACPPTHRHGNQCVELVVRSVDPITLLPAFLQKIVQYPSSSATDLPIECADTSTSSIFVKSDLDSLKISSLASIWRPNQEESRQLRAFLAANLQRAPASPGTYRGRWYQLLQYQRRLGLNPKRNLHD